MQWGLFCSTRIYKCQCSETLFLVLLPDENENGMLLLADVGELLSDLPRSTGEAITALQRRIRCTGAS